ncbi:hypothetical protein GLYMA_06G255950v4 [Glycine max]|nr:hypothetical protein GLYMA_06G255950v4 [Glycine max]KAH1127592.1 hypothetical protein GYH30_016268 [Glycine max]
MALIFTLSFLTTFICLCVLRECSYLQRISVDGAIVGNLRHHSFSQWEL